MDVRSSGSVCKQVLGWFLLAVSLAAVRPVFAQSSFSADMAAGLDNASFTYLAYTDGSNPPLLVAGEGVGGDDAVRTGQITQPTGSTSAENGVYFDFNGPGTLSFQWRVDGQPIVGGVGTLLQYFLSGPGGTNGFITGRDLPFQQVVVPVPQAASYRFIVTYTRSAGSVAQGADAGWIDQLVWTPAGGSDTTPDAFSFTTQNDVTRSTLLTSNSISVSGIDAAADISISACTSSSCEYAINGGAWTAAAGAAAVSNGDAIQVRQTSSDSYATATTLTLDIGGVTGAFTVTTETEPAPVPVIEDQTATGSGTASAFVEPSGNTEPGCNVSAAEFLNAPVAPPEGVNLPHGLFGFTSSGCTEGFSVDVRIDYPAAIPAGASYWKYDAVSGWYTIPATIIGNTVSFTLIDNGLGDSNLAAGTITDPGGIGVGAPLMDRASPVPALSPWMLAALAAALALLSLARIRRGAA